ncbi:hypothetical protein [Helicobacter rodentium]|uniref:hypothetical protein n=1 Tax=Helicobacter rodentium TaxID=59617 RepID=UPI0012EBA7BC|nr:hypothetical protein [Helicobacter rodentium]
MTKQSIMLHTLPLHHCEKISKIFVAIYNVESRLERFHRKGFCMQDCRLLH